MPDPDLRDYEYLLMPDRLSNACPLTPFLRSEGCMSAWCPTAVVLKWHLKLAVTTGL